MRLILKGSSSPIRHKIKKEKNASSSLFSTPSGARLRYLQLRNRVLNIDIPPKSPFGKGGLRQGSRQWVYKQKNPMEKPSDFLLYPLRGSNPGPQH